MGPRRRLRSRALTRKLALLSEEVIGIDSDRGCLDKAQAAQDGTSLTFLEGDVLTAPLFQNFDFIVAVATLHHLPLSRALERFRDLLRPGGVLVIVGLYKIATPIDYAYSATAMPMSTVIRFMRGQEEVGAPLQDSSETLAGIRRERAPYYCRVRFCADGSSFGTALCGAGQSLSYNLPNLVRMTDATGWIVGHPEVGRRTG